MFVYHTAVKRTLIPFYILIIDLKITKKNNSADFSGMHKDGTRKLSNNLLELTFFDNEIIIQQLNFNMGV